MKTPTARLLRIALTALLLQGLFSTTAAELTCPAGMDEVCFRADNFDENVAQNCLIGYDDIIKKAMKYCTLDHSDERKVKVVEIKDMVESDAQKRLLVGFSRIRQRRLGGCRRCSCTSCSCDPLLCKRRRLLSKPTTEKVTDEASDLAPKLLRRHLENVCPEETLSTISYDKEGFDNEGIACCIARVLDDYFGSSQWVCDKTEKPTELTKNDPWFGKCST